MDTTRRLITKSITWQVSGLLVMTLIGYLFTNSFTAGGSIAIASALVGFISYFMHEMMWSKIGWGRS
ncbi:MAG: DUF2061 domain-containing protein [Alphaproteobacteria bacterium]|nr:DUF2061 domain-containing protein [Alphaproteobacteria bacterium]